MKTLLQLFALATGLTVLTPASAQAGDHHHGYSRSVSHQCGSCGSAVYRQRVFAGYNRCGEPMYVWRSASHYCAPRHSRGHGSGHGHGNSHRHGH